MSDKITFLFRLVFNAWEQTIDGETTKYPPFTFDCYLDVPVNIVYGAEEEELDVQKAIVDYFKKCWKQSRKTDFDGNIEFMQEAERVIFLPQAKEEQ